MFDEARWQEILAKGLDSGDHAGIEAGVCAMEAAAYIAREPWSDHPKCVDVAIGAFMRSWNDALPTAERAILLPLIPLTLNTAGSAALAERRALMAVDWYVRVHTPAWLRLAGLTKQADNISALPELVALGGLPSLRGPLEAVRDDASAAWSAAESAAWSAARSAAWSAARSAAWSAARSAARSAAWSAAESAAWSAARSAAESAAWSAAESAAWSAARSAAESAARSAARSAAWSAAESAAWSAARSAAESAAWSAAESAAWSAARSAAESAARSAARSAAWSAAESALEKVRVELQASAALLLERMCMLTEADVVTAEAEAA